MMRIIQKPRSWPTGYNLSRDIDQYAVYLQPKGGVEGGPALIRQQGLTGQLQQLGFHVKDYGDMAFTSVPNDRIGAGVKNPRTIGNAMHQVSNIALNFCPLGRKFKETDL